MPYISVSDMKYLIHTQINRKLVDEFETEGSIEKLDKLIWKLQAESEKYEYEHKHAQKMDQQLTDIISLVYHLLGWCESRGMSEDSLQKHMEIVDMCRKTINDYRYEWHKIVIEDVD